MTHKLDERCGVCASWTWCGRQCANRPVTNKPESVTNITPKAKTQPPSVTNSVTNSQSRVTNRTDAQRVADWRAQNADRYRTYMRELMRKKREQT